MNVHATKSSVHINICYARIQKDAAPQHVVSGNRNNILPRAMIMTPTSPKKHTDTLRQREYGSTSV